MKRKSLKLIIGIFLCFCVSEVFSFSVKKQVEQGKKAPDFELETISGKTAKLSDFIGKVVILHFWKSN